MQRVAWSFVFFLCGCSNVVVPGERELAESTSDLADRECRVVLRRADRVEGAPPLVAATIDVDTKLLADPGATPGVLFRADGGGWQSVDAALVDGAPAGFARYVGRFAVTKSAD